MIDNDRPLDFWRQLVRTSNTAKPLGKPVSMLNQRSVDPRGVFHVFSILEESIKILLSLIRWLMHISAGIFSVNLSQRK